MPIPEYPEHTNPPAEPHVYQPSLFPEEYPSTPTPSAEEEAARIALIAEAISAAARPVEYPDRISDAATDQGWGPDHEIPTDEDTVDSIDLTPQRAVLGSRARTPQTSTLEEIDDSGATNTVNPEGRSDAATKEQRRVDELFWRGQTK